MYDTLYKKFEKLETPIEVILVGVGFMGFGILSAVKSTKGIRIPLIISRRVEETIQFLTEKGYHALEENNPTLIAKNAQKGIISVSNNLALIATYKNSVVIEVTGTVEYGTEVAMKALSAKKHLITMNPELQATVGKELKILADQNGVILTDVYGDQPGSLTRLIASAKLMGFTVRMAGNMKRYLDQHATQEQMRPWAEDKGLAVRQTTSFTDGTKQAIEMNLVANYYGMKVLKQEMVGPQVETIQEVLTKFDWDTIPKEGVVDYVIGRNLFPGIFIVVEHTDPHQQQYLRYLGLGDGPQYVLFEPYHLCHLEVIQTIGKVVFFQEETINNGTQPTTKTIAKAKRDLLPGETLDGIGGDMMYGVIDNESAAFDSVPIGLLHNAVVTKTIQKGMPIRQADVSLPITISTLLSGHTKTQKEEKPSLIFQIAQKMLHLF